MAKRDEIVNFLDKYLKVSEIPDSSVNGLQVEGKGDVKKIALAVDACQYVFDEARSRDVDMVIVHHGLFWKDDDMCITGILKKRLETLLKSRISLYAAHLPLDMHPDVGNNACMAKLLDLKDRHPFGNYHGVNCGCYGLLQREYTMNNFLKLVEEKIGEVQVKHLFGAKNIKTVGIVSGGGAFAVSEMLEHRIDILISGEPKHVLFNDTKELCMNAVYLGHYATETFGVKALGNKLKEKFKYVEIVFIDNPTGM